MTLRIKPIQIYGKQFGLVQSTNDFLKLVLHLDNERVVLDQEFRSSCFQQRLFGVLFI